MIHEIIKVYRWCPRCERWRSYGNFSGGRHVCMLCVPPGTNRRHLTERTGWTLTPKGRMYLGVDSIPA